MGLLKQFEYAEPPEEVIETKEVSAPEPVVEVVPVPSPKKWDMDCKRNKKGLIESIGAKNQYGENIRFNFERNGLDVLEKISVIER